MKKRKEEFSISDFIELFIPKLWLIVIAALVLSVALGGYSAFIKDDTYTSESTIMVAKQNTTVNSTDVDLASKLVENFSIVVFTDNFLRLVIAEVQTVNPDYVLTTDSLRSILKFEQIGETEAFTISVTTTDPFLSHAVAETVSQFVQDKVPDMLPYEQDIIFAEIIDQAMIPMTPNSKNVVRNAAVGFLAGAVIAMLAIFLHSMFDVTIRDRKKIEDNFDIPVLGVIPRFITDEEGK